MDDAAQAEIAAAITQRLYGEFALKEDLGSTQCSKLTNVLIVHKNTTNLFASWIRWTDSLILA